MPRSSQTDLAVLGALSIAPMTGYQVRAAILGTLGHFWAESYGQIYPALTRLEASGQIRRAADGRTSGSLFELTGSGRTALRALLAAPPDRVPPRNGVLLRLFFGDTLGSAGCRQLLEDVAGQAQSALAGYAAVRAEVAAEPHSPGVAFRLMTLSAGEHSARSSLAWATECLAVLDGVDSAPERAPGAGPDTAITG